MQPTIYAVGFGPGDVLHPKTGLMNSPVLFFWAETGCPRDGREEISLRLLKTGSASARIF